MTANNNYCDNAMLSDDGLTNLLPVFQTSENK